jgi:hypothetical protein
VNCSGWKLSITESGFVFLKGNSSLNKGQSKDAIESLSLLLILNTDEQIMLGFDFT